MMGFISSLCTYSSLFSADYFLEIMLLERKGHEAETLLCQELYSCRSAVKPTVQAAAACDWSTLSPS